MPSTASPSSTAFTPASISPVSGIWPAASRSSSSSSKSRRTRAGSPWLRLAVVGALLAIAVQILVMAQLAQHQVQRGVQLRQALAAEKTESAAGVRAEADTPLRTASVGQGDADSVPAYVLH